MEKLISIIIPVYNEEKDIGACLDSLDKQSYKSLEIILVDDGSTDKTVKIIKNFQLPGRQSPSGGGSTFNCKLFRQKHLGPGPARNLGASYAKGEILAFVDADMTFDKNFIKDLVDPIIKGQTIGTFSKNEMNANKDNIWSRCWNINRGWPVDRLIPKDYPNKAPVFRAILKKEFARVEGFDATGEYTDDWSLSKKLGKKSTLANGAVYYHSNPATLSEVYKQARWIGKNEFISGDFFRKCRSLILYNFFASLIIGIYKSLLTLKFYFVFFKLTYDCAVFFSVIGSFFREHKAK